MPATQMQVAKPREAEVEKRIPASALGEGTQAHCVGHSTEIVKGLEKAGLLET